MYLSPYLQLIIDNIKCLVSLFHFLIKLELISAVLSWKLICISFPSRERIWNLINNKGGCQPKGRYLSEIDNCKAILILSKLILIRNPIFHHAPCQWARPDQLHQTGSVRPTVCLAVPGLLSPHICKSWPGQASVPLGLTRCQADPPMYSCAGEDTDKTGRWLVCSLTSAEYLWCEEERGGESGAEEGSEAALSLQSHTVSQDWSVTVRRLHQHHGRNTGTQSHSLRQ